MDDALAAAKATRERCEALIGVAVLGYSTFPPARLFCLFDLWSRESARRFLVLS